MLSRRPLARKFETAETKFFRKPRWVNCPIVASTEWFFGFVVQKMRGNSSWRAGGVSPLFSHGPTLTLRNLCRVLRLQRLAKLQRLRGGALGIDSCWTEPRSRDPTMGIQIPPTFLRCNLPPRLLACKDFPPAICGRSTACRSRAGPGCQKFRHFAGAAPRPGRTLSGATPTARLGPCPLSPATPYGPACDAATLGGSGATGSNSL
jgi:hypothetical protein